MLESGRRLLDSCYRLSRRASIATLVAVFVLIAVSGCDRKQDENDPGQATIAYLNALATGDRNTTLSTTCGPINWFLEKTTDKQFMEFRSSVFGNSKSPKFEVARSKKTGDDYLVVVRQDGVEKPDDALLVSLDQDGHYKVCDSQAEPAGTPAPYSPAP